MFRRGLSGLRSAARGTRLRFAGSLSARPKENVEDKMQAWQIHSYGGLEELRLSSVRIPHISSPTQVLVKVDAASVNPIDVAMIRGYGASLLNVMRRAKNLTVAQSFDMELPLTLGRDFSGTIVSKGHGVGDDLRLGDEVWGVVPVDQQGCHSSYVIVDKDTVSVRPRNISYVEAASILYAGLTAWSALWITGGLCYKTMIDARRNKRVLVLGGSGGVGTLAIQMLKAWGMHVVTTCSNDAVNMLEKLGADIVIDYKLSDADLQISTEGPYDIILDCANQGPGLVRAKGYPYTTYVHLNSPLLKHIDEYGFIPGMMKNIQELVRYNLPIGDNKGSVKWGYFVPSRKGLTMIQELVEGGEVVPVVNKVYPFEEVPSAYEKLAKGHSRGKLVIDMR